MSVSPLNQILYGPPGTGKTHATVDTALQILDPAYLAQHPGEAGRAALKGRFDELAAQGRIRFVTFHQSFSYEDFVEGLRAVTDEETGALRYEVVDGVFKGLCQAASVQVTQQAPVPADWSSRRVWKMSLGSIAGADAGVYEDCVLGGFVLLGYGKAIDFTGCRNDAEVLERYQQAQVNIENVSDYSVASVARFVAKMKVGDLVVVTEGNLKFRAIAEITGDYEFSPNPEYGDSYAQKRKVKWLRQYVPALPANELLSGLFMQKTLYELKSPSLDKAKLAALLDADAGTAPFREGQTFGTGYTVARVSADVVELKKPNGNDVSFAMSMLKKLAYFVDAGVITLDDIQAKTALPKLEGAEFEPYIVHGYNNILPPLVKQLTRQADASSVTSGTVDPHARVLIIDEINRGNMSRIFGELITLIEPSKRQGAEEALAVTLPYSKASFSVPNNLYLVGTMNTADRSLAGLDIALRRRFVFKEMPPQPSLLKGHSIAGVDLELLLTTLNQRIEALLDRDHCLGHAYFMPLRNGATLADLHRVFENQVVPLLQEYFFEDWQRIQWVLNDHRKANPSHRFVIKTKVNAEALFGQDVNLSGAGQGWEINASAFGRIEAYAGIIGAVAAAPVEADAVAAEQNEGAFS